jgi:hypothetical protein
VSVQKEEAYEKEGRPDEIELLLDGQGPKVL